MNAGASAEYHGGVRLFAVVLLFLALAAPAPGQGSNRHWDRLSALDAAALVAELVDDDVRWNAEVAVRVIPLRLADEAALGVDGPMVRALFAALDSRDLQQRDMAGQLLVNHLDDWRDRTGLWPWPEEAVHRVLRVAVDQLGGAWSWWASAPVHGAYDFLEPVVAEARPYLVEGMRRAPQEDSGLLCAALLSHTRDPLLLPDAAPILLRHLRDNGCRWDAILSLPALYRFGPATIPYLQEALSRADEQQRACIQLLLLDFVAPPVTRADYFQRRRLNRITWKVDDPAYHPADPCLYGR